MDVFNRDGRWRSVACRPKFNCAMRGHHYQHAGVGATTDGLVTGPRGLASPVPAAGACGPTGVRLRGACARATVD